MNNFPEKIHESVEAVGDAVAAANPIPSIQKHLESFGEADAVAASSSSSFLQSNSVLAKLSFLILVLICFVLLLKYATFFLASFATPKQSTYLIRGLIPGNNAVVVKQNPADPNAVTIWRSNNEKTGMEFTYSFWLYLGTSAASGTAQSIFVKGGATGFVQDDHATVDGVLSKGMSAVGHAPGVYVVQNNVLRVAMDTFDQTRSTQILDVPNIPMNKWVHLAIRLQNTYLDVYANGVVAKRAVLAGIPKQNYADVQVCPNGGFSGSLSDLQYHPQALSAARLQSMLADKPNIEPSKSAGGSLAKPKSAGNYLSYLWFT